MRLSDIMSRMGLTSWAEIALLIFFGVFVGMTIYVFAVRKRSRWEEARYLPLEGEPPEEPTDESDESGNGGGRPPMD